MSGSIHEVVIVGSGPAGWTAALYTARAALSPVVLCGSGFVGGALTTTSDVENYPGFPDGVQGPDLMLHMRAQAERFGAETLEVDATALDLAGEVKTVTDAAGTTHRARSVIVATGAGYRTLDIPGEREFSGRGVSWCATCDGFFFRGLDLAVVGGGDSALEEATFLTRYARSVTVVHRRETLRASRIMQERAFADPKITFAYDREVTAVHGDDTVTGVTLRETRGTGEQQLAVDGLFIAIGHDPRSELLRGQLDLDPDGHVLVRAPSTRTNVPGVFAAGDLVDHTYRQAVTAAAMGCSAALDAERYLSSATVVPGVATAAVTPEPAPRRVAPA